jgi:hypothetical protein
MTREISIRRSYGLAERGSYVRLPFDVPEGLEAIDLEYSYPRYRTEERPEGRLRAETSIIDLGLIDQAGRLRGWSGSERSSVSVSATSATPGYTIGAIRPGRWAVALGLYRLEVPVEVVVTIRLVEKREILLVGDLHVHTTNSDGACGTAELVELCAREGLDFVALTDHNSTRQNDEVGGIGGITVIPGMEYTNYRGHANLFFRSGRDRFDRDLFSGSFEEMKATLDAAREMGAVVSLNHPHCSSCPWTFGFEGFRFDMVEVWNGTGSPGDTRAVQWWHGRLSRGERLPAVGGSDFHRHEIFRSLGGPATFVHAASRSEEDILAALLAGRSFISFSRSGPFVDLRIAGRGLGQSVPRGAAGEGLLSVREARSGDRILLLDGRGRSEERLVPFDGEYSAPFAVADDAVFYRMELWRRHPAGLPLLYALSNPVYLEPGPAGP